MGWLEVQSMRQGTMMRATLVLLAALTAAGTAGKRDANKKDLERLQGDWLVVNAFADGRRQKPRSTRHIRLAGDQMARYGKEFDAGRVLWDTVSIDGTKQPAQMDIEAPNAHGRNPGGVGSPAPATILAIYKIEGDTLTVCHSTTGSPRPKEFASPRGSSVIVLVYRREKK
jgi:RNA polymerase sigma-70 factor (ECF subfamily)